MKKRKVGQNMVGGEVVDGFGSCSEKGRGETREKIQ